ncbi:MAG: outer membrane lipoprotein-sorting protein [Candidatus Latescibacterota bacterium]|nr:MAG: outer membrane lipoprotein-sorting protein [Candidatus Latescibacterota bacterium]
MNAMIGNARIVSALVVVAALCCAPMHTGPTAAQNTAGDDVIQEIIKEIDELYRSKSSYAEFEMHVVTPHWERTMAMNAWSAGMDRTFIRITAPRKDNGVATLRIGNEMWNYLPKTNKIIKIPPSMMMSSWMGSDFTNDDIVREFSLYEDYSYAETSVGDPDSNLIYIDCVPRADLAVVWRHVVIAVRRSDHLPVWQKYYDEKDELMRVMNFRDIKTFGKRTIPSVMEIVPQNKEGHRTQVRYLKLEFDIDVDENIFSLRNLRTQT